MNRQEQYYKYCEMHEKAQQLTKEIEEELPKNYAKVYCVFICVADEEKELYNIDIEVGGSAETYHRWRGLYTEQKLRQRFL